MAQLTEREIVALVDQEFESSMGAPEGEISNERAKAWRYYNSQPLGNEIDGKSKFVTSDVSDVVDGIMPSLLKMFTDKDNLVSFDPVGPEDEQLSRQETEYTSYVFWKKTEDPFMALYSWFWDALVQKNGIVKAWVDESEVVTEETYSNLSEIELFKLLEDEELEPIERDERVDPELGVLHDVRFKRTCKKKRICVEPVPPEEYRISSDANAVNPSKARMVGQERKMKRSDLISMGFDASIVMDLPAESRDWDSPEKNSRRGIDEDREGYPDPSQEEVGVREAYIKLDSGNGKSELRQIFVSNGHLLSNEPADRQPFHVLTSKPLPHKHFGTCPAEMVMDIQDITTTITRQMLDNAYRVNNPERAVWEQAIGEHTLDDLMSTEIGKINRFERPVSESYQEMTTPFTAGQMFPVLEWWDKTKRDRTGVHSDADGLDPTQLKHIQNTVMSAQMDIARGKIETIARIFAETGIKSLFLHIHELIRKHTDKAEVVKLRGDWVPVDPSSWRDRFDVTVNIGLGIASRESNLIHLNAVKEIQKEMVTGGGMNLTVTPQNIYKTALEIARNANLPTPEAYFTDPGDQTAPPSSQEQQQIQMQAQAIQQKEEELKSREDRLNKTMLEHERKMLEMAQKKEFHDDDLAVKYEELHNELTELKLKYEQPVGGANGRVQAP